MSFDVILPFLQPIAHLMTDPDVTEIMVNAGGAVFVEAQGVTTLPAIRMTERDLQAATRKHDQLQLADLVAGAAATYYRHFHNGESAFKAEYARKLADAGMEDIVINVVWPTAAVDLFALGTDGPALADAADFHGPADCVSTKATELTSLSIASTNRMRMVIVAIACAPLVLCARKALTGPSQMASMTLFTSTSARYDVFGT